MKTLRTLTTTLICLCIIPTAAAAIVASPSVRNTANTAVAESSEAQSPKAQSAETQYPEASLFTSNLTFKTLHDYAITSTDSGTTFALAGTASTPATEAEKSNGYYIYQNNSYEFYLSPSQQEIVQVEYSQDGTLYLADTLGTVYTQSGEQVSGFSFSADETATIGKTFYVIGDNQISIIDCTQNTPVSQTLTGEYKNLTQANNTVYVQKGNAIYSLTSFTESEVKLPYINFGQTENIAVGQTFSLIKEQQTPRFVNIETDSYITAIDLDQSAKSESGCFVVGETRATKQKISMALLLCETGNAWLIATESGCYLTAKPQNAEYNPASITTKSGSGYTSAACKLYASPYASEATTLAAFEIGTKVEITGEVSHSTYPYLSTDWYAVTYTKGGVTTSGYIPSGLIYGYSFSAESNSYSEQSPSAYSENNVVRMAVLIMVVVTLILLLLGYLTIVATKKKKSPRSKSVTPPDPPSEE